MTDHDIDVLLRAATHGGQIGIPTGWGQGRATFGGAVAGALVARALGELGADAVTLRSVTTNFLAPVLPGPATLICEILRRGSSATQIDVRLLQAGDDDEPTARAISLLTFGAERESALALVPAPTGDLPAFDSLQPILREGAPDFFSHFDLRLASGGLPFSGSPTAEMAGWMRFRELPDEFGLAHFVALVDSWPPVTAQLLDRPSPLSTMTWTLELLGPLHGTPETPWWYEVRTDAAHHGYAHTEAKIYSPHRRMVAISRQTIAHFA